MLHEFIKHCYLHPAARVKLIAFLRAFREAHPDVARLPRSYIIAELARAGYTVGRDGRGQAWIVGLSLKPMKRWSVRDDGRLVKVE